MTVSTFTLTDDQQKAMSAFTQFLTDPLETVFVLSGYSGTGKTTLVKTLIDRLSVLMKTARLINPDVKTYRVELTATTNKAAENFAHITGIPVCTIHSFLGLRVENDVKNKTSKLVPGRKTVHEGLLLFIDEASYIDKTLLQYIFQFTKNSKIVFMGDPAQLTPVMTGNTPVFEAKFNGAALTQVVRQAEGHPIVDLATKFRETVNTGEFFQFTPDGQHVQYMDRDSFNKAVLAEFTRSDWKYKDSKVLGWTNNCAIKYNHMVRDAVIGDPDFQVGDYAICNKFVSKGRKAIKTDQLVCITMIDPIATEYDVLGNYVTLDYGDTFFFPKSRSKKNAAIRHYRSNNDFSTVAVIENEWIDLRSAYACTINKSQGSTFDRVFIDLDDVSRCNIGDQIARMLYVGVSRARHQVFLTGDLV